MSVYSHRSSLYKRPTGYYHIGYYRDGVHRWKSTGATTKREALAFLSRFREVTQERARSVSLEQFIKEFLDYSQGNHSHKTVALFRAILERFSRLFPHAALREITPEHVDRFETRRLRDVKPVSVNVELRMLNSAFSTARRWKLIDATH